MPRIKVDYRFSAEVIDSTKPTKDGHWYTAETIDEIVEQVESGRTFIIEEFNPIEREIKKVPLSSVWKEQVMGHCIGAKNVGGRLVMEFKCDSNRHGKKLMNICENYGIKNLKIFPVGFGNLLEKDGRKTVVDYTLTYVAFEG